MTPPNPPRDTGGRRDTGTPRGTGAARLVTRHDGLPETVVDPDTLRDAFVDPRAAAAWLDALLAAPPPDAATRDDAAAWHTDVGRLARGLRRLDVAERHLRRAAELRPGVRPTLRLAHALQWQGRFAEARTLFTQCVAKAPHDSFARQHAGKCAYDEGRWAEARDHFAAALKLREADDPVDAELVASARLAWDAADACDTASLARDELHRLVPAVHRAAAQVGAPLLAPLRPHGGVLIDIRTLLLRGGPVPWTAVRAIHRHARDLDTAVAALADAGWLTVDADAITATDRCRDLLEQLMAGLDRVTAELWPEPTVEVAAALVDELVAEPFSPLAAAGHPHDGNAAGRLFTGLCTLRWDRADAHARAWADADREPAGATDDERHAVETRTDVLAARRYRPVARRAALIPALRALPDGA